MLRGFFNSCGFMLIDGMCIFILWKDRGLINTYGQ